MRGVVCAALLLAAPGGGMRVTPPGGNGTAEAPITLHKVPFGGRGLAIVVMLTGGKRAVNQANFQDGKFEKSNVGEIDNLQLFDNWMQFFPKASRKQLKVLCADQQCVDHMERTYPQGPDHLFHKATKGDLSQQKTREELMRLRVKYIDQLLGKTYTVLVCDVDAIWLQNPIPYLEKTTADVVALRDEDSWHSASPGFMLFRPSGRQHIKDKAVIYRLYKDDKKLFHAAFTEVSGTTWVDNKDGSSVATNAGAKTETLLLPSDQFTRSRHLDVPNCLPNQAMRHDRHDGPVCIDKHVMVVHNMGEVYRSKMATPHGRLWRLPEEVAGAS